MSQKGWATVDIERDDFEPVSYNVQYEICPAEPDVGIMMEYVEIFSIEIDGISVSVSENEFEQITREVEAQIWP